MAKCFSEKIADLTGGLSATGSKVTKVANTMKAMRSSMDLSAPLRQGIGLVHRPEYRDAFKEMFKYLNNKEYYSQAMSDLEKRPSYLLGRESGLFLAKPDSLLSGEEAFMNTYLGELPSGAKGLFIKDIAGASERAYTGFLNKLRADTFENLIRNAKDMGHQPFLTVDGKIAPSKVAENIAKYINVSTGRGGLGKLEKIAPELNSIIWSPRLISSRLTILNPKYYTAMDKFTQREAIKSLFAIAGAGLTMTGLGALAGGKVSSNPLSADFGKVRFGSNNVLDPHAGFQQIIVAAARLISGSNEVKPQSRAATMGNFAENKLSPIAALAYDIASSKDFDKSGGYTDRFNNKKNVGNEVANSFVPLFIENLKEVMQGDPSFAESVGLDTAALFGAGVQNYPERRNSGGLSLGGMRKLSP